MPHRAPLGFSTSCFGARHVFFREQVEAARRLGFDCIEVGRSDSPPRWEEAQAALEAFGVSAPVLRAGCRDVAQGSYRPCEAIASTSEESRKNAIQSILGDIDLARKTSSPILAVPAGVVGIPGIVERVQSLANHIRQGRERETLELKEESRLATGPLRLKHLDRLCRSLFEIGRKEPAISIVLETPRDPHFLPTPQELEQIFEDLPGAKLGYLHDVGAAAAVEIYAGIPQGVWLERFAPRLQAARLHDTIGLEQGHPPGTGEIDWKLLAGYLPRQAHRFLDLDPQHGAEGARIAVRFLEKFGF